MSDDWLEQLQKLHDADKAKRQANIKQEQPQAKMDRAADLLRRSQAHQLMRQVQKFLLAGKGQLEIAEATGQYDRVITLIWQGPISAARTPSPEDPDEYNYILVGVRKEKIWVNGKALPSATPKALKAALLSASQNPGRGAHV